MVRVLLAVLAWPVVILVAIWIFEVVDEHYLNPPVEKEFVYDHPKFMHMARDALASYAALGEDERSRFRNELQGQLVTVESWAAELDRTGFTILCIGEDHIDLTREYLATQVFSRFRVDVVLLEATPEETTGMLRRIESGDSDVDMLGAQIDQVIMSIRKRNPEAVFRGIEETDSQKEKRLDQAKAGIRDESIVRNVWENFIPGRRHAILFGAIHCNNWPKWLYQRTRASAPSDVLAGMSNLKVVERKQDSLIDPFLYFLDEIGIERRDFVIGDTTKLDPLLLKWFSLMVPQIFSQYESILVFRRDK